MNTWYRRANVPKLKSPVFVKAKQPGADRVKRWTFRPCKTCFEKPASRAASRCYKNIRGGGVIDEKSRMDILLSFLVILLYH